MPSFCISIIFIEFSPHAIVICSSITSPIFPDCLFILAKINKQSGKIGEVIDEQMTIACGENSINIIEIQKEGKNPQLINEFLLGNKVRKGTIITSE